MLKWLRRLFDRRPAFEYIAHEYLRDTWRCLRCTSLVHANALAGHARTAHGMDTARLHIRRVERTV